MIIDCISDLHGFFPNDLPGGDLLIVAGDLTASDSEKEIDIFGQWLCRQNYKLKIYIAGNHDNFCQKRMGPADLMGINYLCDSGTEFQGLKIWGSPWTLRFEGMNPDCMAFTVDTEEELAEKWAFIPDDTEILVTHSPSWGSNDTTECGKRVGSKSLCYWIANHANTLKLHVCGHIHEAYGIWDVRKIQCGLGDLLTPVLVNASHVNERYQPINKPIRITL